MDLKLKNEGVGGIKPESEPGPRLFFEWDEEECYFVKIPVTSEQYLILSAMDGDPGEIFQTLLRKWCAGLLLGEHCNAETYSVLMMVRHHPWWRQAGEGCDDWNEMRDLLKGYLIDRTDHGVHVDDPRIQGDRVTREVRKLLKKEKKDADRRKDEGDQDEIEDDEALKPKGN